MGNCVGKKNIYDTTTTTKHKCSTLCALSTTHPENHQPDPANHVIESQIIEPQNHVPLPPNSIPSAINLEELKTKCAILDLKGDISLCYCVKAYDGDTCTLNIHNNKIGNYQWRVRMTGFDAPELKTKNAQEKMHALACRDMLAELIYNKFCVIQCHGLEKWGRILGTLYIQAKTNTPTSILTETCTPEDVKALSSDIDHEVINDNNHLLNVNEWMLKYTPCVPYDGGHKEEIVYHLEKYHPHYLKHYEKYYNLQNNNNE